ncbi:orotidine-5'-phosphate decarboxylase [Haliscomenobacter sp.]|uniref:orotidine-5'-phosphate decarboxylase n=1 Tax=Haliscomenobacter sp. TaxID=2717303 RepID=UPI003593842A
MNRAALIAQIRRKKSFLCVGLDTEWSKIPAHLLETEDPIFEFNKAIIDATRDLCVAYKPNLAFYEARGPQGWLSLQKTINYIGEEHFTIADAKRGDIGNTSRLYAQTFFETYTFNSVTVAPYMGADSVQPFLDFPNKWVILLALTSNEGSSDFQIGLQDGALPLYEKVMRKAMTWGTPENLMFVIGATHPDKFADIRRIAPDHFLLVPGVGTQGGDLDALCQYGLNQDIGLLVNASRGIIYAGSGLDFADKARAAAQEIQSQMAKFIK